MDGVNGAPNTTESGFTPRIGRSVSMDYAAELLRLSRRTLYNHIRRGVLRTVRTPNGSQRVLLESMIELLRHQRDTIAQKYARRSARRYS